jgi:glutamate dehydrogenase (NADP+)
MSQNAAHCYWSAAEVDTKLQKIMSDIHNACVDAGDWDYVAGANIAGFRKVAAAMIAQGV